MMTRALVLSAGPFMVYRRPTEPARVTLWRGAGEVLTMKKKTRHLDRQGRPACGVKAKEPETVNDRRYVTCDRCARTKFYDEGYVGLGSRQSARTETTVSGGG